MYISSAHSATVQASCWKAASPSLFCLLPLKSTDSNGRSWRPAWKNGCSAFTSGRYGERLNVDLLTWNVHKCPVFLKYSILQSKVFFHSLLSKFHPLDIMLYPTVDCGISMTLTFMAKIYARHPCACFRVLSTGLQINFLGNVQTLNTFTGIYISTCFNSVVIPHSERPHKSTKAVEPTVFLWKLIPIHQLHDASTSNIPVAFTAKAMVITEVLSDSWICVCVFVHVCALKSMPIGKKKDQAKIPQNFMWDHWRGIYNLERPSCAEVIRIQQDSHHRPSLTFPNHFCVIHAPQKQLWLDIYQKHNEEMPTKYQHVTQTRWHDLWSKLCAMPSYWIFQNHFQGIQHSSRLISTGQTIQAVDVALLKIHLSRFDWMV